MNNIIIRHALLTDNLNEISKCIYLTDPFIYPAAFGEDIHNAVCAIKELILIENGLFNTNNILVALNENTICGILVYNKNGALWNTNEALKKIKSFIPNVDTFNKVSHYYFAEEAKQPESNHIEIIACCVMPQYRNKGIAKQLLNNLMTIHPHYSFTLDVLADNASAIQVYKKCGFAITQKYKGFHINDNEKPDCYHMVKKSNL